MVQTQETKRADPGAQESRTFNLDEVDAVDVVRFGGESYDLARADGLSLRKQARLLKCRRRFAVLAKIDEPTEDDEHEYRKLNREVAAIALPDAAEDAIAKLDDGKLERLVIHFFVRTAQRSEMVQVARDLAEISDVISPPFSTSTAATPSDGST
jgi:hypothetical protein